MQFLLDQQLPLNPLQKSSMTVVATSRLPNEVALRMSQGTLRQPGAVADVVKSCAPVTNKARGGRFFAHCCFFLLWMTDSSST